MNDPMRNFAEKMVKTARLAVAVWYFTLASAFGLGAFYLLIAFQNWFAWSFAIVFAVVGLGSLLDASEAYVSARPLVRPDERQRYFESRSLYLPGDRRENRRHTRQRSWGAHD
jgi:fatty acid desaturase